MSTVTLEDAQARLAELIARLQPGEEITITRDDKPVARVVGTAAPDRPPPKLGTLKGTVLYMAPDFDAPLEEFKEYMP
jgi:prevent-host-death family protein